MITLYGFGRVHPKVIGYTRDMRVQWGLEEVGLPYRVQGMDHSAGELDSPAFHELSYFHQVPVIEDEGFIVAESAAILLYLAEKSGKLLPKDLRGRTEVTQWCFAALASVELPLSQIIMIDMMGEGGPEVEKRRAGLVKWAERCFAGVERRLDGRDCIAGADFTVADILLVTVLREIRTTDLMEAYPKIKSYYARAQARPAWQRTLGLYADRLGVTVADIA